MLVCNPLLDLIENEALPGSGVTASDFWQGLSTLVHDFGPLNRALLAKRVDLQNKIDEWHRGQRVHHPVAYTAFLKQIGYLEEPIPDFKIETQNIDPEIAVIPGPQLVVPIMNARYALNAANARWGSLYDALYGTDAMGDAPPPGPFDAARGVRVIAWAKAFLDQVVPLTQGSHTSVSAYFISEGALVASTPAGPVGLADPTTFVAFTGEAQTPSTVLLSHNHLHIEIVIDRSHSIGQGDAAGVADVILEAAVTTIMDCEDSVAAVDATDKVFYAFATRLFMPPPTGAGLSQLVGTNVRHATRDGYQGWQLFPATPGRRPPLHGRWRGASRSQGPLTNAHSQCRASDDDAGCARSRW